MTKGAPIIDVKTFIGMSILDSNNLIIMSQLRIKIAPKRMFINKILNNFS